MSQEHVDALSIRDLRAALKSAGLQNGPITASTEHVYRTALYKYLTGADETGSSPHSSGSEVECVDSRSASDGEDLSQHDPASEIPGQKLLTGTPTRPRTQFAPVRWNPKQQRYESVYGESSDSVNKEGEDNQSKGVRKWLLLMAVAVMLLAVVIAIIFLSGDRDPYKILEDAASRISTQGQVPGHQ